MFVSPRLAVLLPILISTACERGTPLEIIDAEDRQDQTSIIKADPGYQAFAIACPAATGCEGSLVLDFEQLGAEAAAVSVLVGRTEDDLREVARTDIDGSAQLVASFAEATRDDVTQDSADGYDATKSVLVMLQLENESPVKYTIDDCLHDIDGASDYLFDGQPVDLNTSDNRRPVFSLHDGSDEDTFSFDVIDSGNFDTSIRTGKAVEVTRTTSRNFSESAVFEVTYTCHSDGEVLSLEVVGETPLDVTLGIDPDCSSLDDSGTVRVTVKDPGADVFSCPKYVLSATAQPSYL